VDLETLLGSVRCVPELSGLVAALGHQPLLEPVPDSAWNKPGQRLLEVTAVGRADGLPWFATASADPRQDALRLARRIRARGAAAIVLSLDPAGRRLAIAAAFDRLPYLELDLADPDPEAIDSLARLAGSSGAGPMAFAGRVADALSTEPVGRRFFREFRTTLDRMAGELPCPMPPLERHAYALLQLTRVLFLYFIQTRGWLAGRERFLAEEVDRCMARGRRIHRDLLRPLFFGTLNRPFTDRSRLATQFGPIPFLNGGLFEPHSLERRCGADVPNVLWCAAFDRLFERFHFTASERSRRGSVAPDMLGRVFEGVMVPTARRASGAFYTPTALVEKILEAALTAFLTSKLRCSESQAERRLRDPDPEVANALRSVTILDPAAGSGAFLLGALERLSRLGLRRSSISARKRRVLQQNLFGVDLNATAVRLAELRLWLAVVADESAGNPERVAPLPNLDCLIRQGDSLFEPSALRLGAAGSAAYSGAAELTSLRRQVVQTAGSGKRFLERRLRLVERKLFGEALDQAQARQRAEIADCLNQARAPDLFGRRRGLDRPLASRLRQLRGELGELRSARRRLAQDGEVPWFHYQSHFADVFAKGGFDLVVGNPPWLRSEAVPAERRAQLSKRYRWWRPSAGSYGNAPDLAVAFLERALELTGEGGVVAMLVPAKLASASYATAARHALASTATLHNVVDLTGHTEAEFEATVYPLAVVASKQIPRPAHRVRSSLGTAESDPTGASVTQSDLRGGAPWILVGNELRQLLGQLTADHLRLSQVITCHLGVKTGLNRVFLNPPASLEPEAMRWAIRGRDLRPFEWQRMVRLLWTHSAGGRPAPELPPKTLKYLLSHERELRSRKDYRSGPWWTLFRVRPALARHRVVWADLSRQLMAVALTSEADRECIPLNSCYVAPVDNAEHAEAIASWLNSSWIRAIGRLGAVPASGGYARYNAAVVSGLPLALSALDDARLIELAQTARAGADVQAELDAVVAEHLGLTSKSRRILGASLDHTTHHRR
jgi:hypothetical protein